jgi:hypothetical protein
MRFNPPPNWPLPPNWTPPPGYTPDPSWGPAPPGWQFWVDDYAPTLAPGQSVPPQYGQSVPPQGFGQSMPPGYAAQYAQPASNKSRNILIGVGVGVVAIIALAITLVFTMRNDDESADEQSQQTTSTARAEESDEDQIRSAVDGMESSWNDSDYDKFIGYWCEENRGNYTENEFDEERYDEGTVSIIVGTIDVRGDEADAEVTAEFSNSTTTTRRPTTTSSNADTETWTFVKRDGEWLFCA